jgi:hypothetical protein
VRRYARSPRRLFTRQDTSYCLDFGPQVNGLKQPTTIHGTTLPSSSSRPGPLQLYTGTSYSAVYQSSAPDALDDTPLGGQATQPHTTSRTRRNVAPAWAGSDTPDYTRSKTTMAASILFSFPTRSTPRMHPFGCCRPNTVSSKPTTISRNERGHGVEH